MNTGKRRSGRLTPRQSRFVIEYLVDLNATHAMRRAGYRGSDTTLSAQASRLLKRSVIAAAVKTSMGARAARTEVTADQVLRELARIAFADIAQLLDEDGRLKPLASQTDATRAAIATFDVEERPGVGVSTKIRFWDKLRALELLGKHLGLFAKHDASGGVTLGQFVTISVVDPYATAPLANTDGAAAARTTSSSASTSALAARR